MLQLHHSEKVQIRELMMPRSIVIPCLLTSLLAGCGSLLSQKKAELAPTSMSSEFGETLTLPAQLRTVTRRQANEKFFTCAEPGPDVALSDTFKLVTGITAERAAAAEAAGSDTSAKTSSNTKGSISNDLQTSTTALELAGRTQTVLLAREFLFRTCEAAANGWLDKEAVKKAHEGTLTQITGMVKADERKAIASGIVAAAAVKLDAKVLGVTADAVQGVIVQQCTIELQACSAKAKDDVTTKACAAAFSTCIK